jgi:hypothetical protein
MSVVNKTVQTKTYVVTGYKKKRIGQVDFDASGCASMRADGFATRYGWASYCDATDDGATGFDTRQEAIDDVRDMHKEWIAEIKRDIRRAKRLAKKWDIRY